MYRLCWRLRIIRANLVSNTRVYAILTGPAQFGAQTHKLISQSYYLFPCCFLLIFQLCTYCVYRLNVFLYLYIYIFLLVAEVALLRFGFLLKLSRLTRGMCTRARSRSLAMRLLFCCDHRIFYLRTIFVSV